MYFDEALSVLAAHSGYGARVDALIAHTRLVRGAVRRGGALESNALPFGISRASGRTGADRGSSHHRTDSSTAALDGFTRVATFVIQTHRGRRTLVVGGTLAGASASGGVRVSE